VSYRCIVADPPWEYDAPGQFGTTLEHRPNRDKTLSRLGSGSASRYGAMSMEDLKALRVREASAEDAHLYLWTTNAFMVEAHELSRSWGFDPKTIITWTKVKPDGTPSMKMGYYFRGATEHCIFAVRGSLRLKGEACSTAILTPRMGHSVKPEIFYRMVEEQSPGPYLEIFARTPGGLFERRDGWDVWGNQAAGSQVAL
jgi:N6-adenosine-specific RNA methylase IME4